MLEKEGGPAFPTEQHENQDNTWNQTYDPGMSLRDWFAGMALSGLLANPEHDESFPLNAEHAYRVADAMLAERKKEGA